MNILSYVTILYQYKIISNYKKHKSIFKKQTFQKIPAWKDACQGLSSWWCKQAFADKYSYYICKKKKKFYIIPWHEKNFLIDARGICP